MVGDEFALKELVGVELLLGPITFLSAVVIAVDSKVRNLMSSGFVPGLSLLVVLFEESLVLTPSSLLSSSVKNGSRLVGVIVSGSFRFGVLNRRFLFLLSLEAREELKSRNEFRLELK